MSDYITARELAQMLGITEGAVSHWKRRKNEPIKPVGRVGSIWLYNREEAEAFAKEYSGAA